MLKSYINTVSDAILKRQQPSFGIIFLQSPSFWKKTSQLISSADFEDFMGPLEILGYIL